MAKIKLAFRLRKVQSGNTLKVALADLYAVKGVSDYLGEYYTATDKEMDPTHLNYPVVISKLDNMVSFGNLTRTSVVNLKIGKWIFVPYSHMTVATR